MKAVACLILLVTVNMVYTDPLRNFRGCQYINGQCVRECEGGSKSYAVECDYATPEPTCRNSHPLPDLSGMICDYSQCYCEEPTVRDPVTNKCVALEDCTK